MRRTTNRHSANIRPVPPGAQSASAGQIAQPRMKAQRAIAMGKAKLFCPASRWKKNLPPTARHALHVHVF